MNKDDPAGLDGGFCGKKTAVSWFSYSFPVLCPCPLSDSRQRPCPGKLYTYTSSRQSRETKKNAAICATQGLASILVLGIAGELQQQMMPAVMEMLSRGPGCKYAVAQIKSTTKMMDEEIIPNWEARSSSNKVTP